MKVKINFSDFWEGFEKEDNPFFNLIKEDLDVQISEDPDFLFFSVFNKEVYSGGIKGEEHKKYKCKKIFYSGEPVPPDYNDCDYSMGFDWIESETHLRLPLYAIWGNSYYDLEDKKIEDKLWDRKFCNFVVSNPYCNFRNDFFLKLNEYKKVDSGGRYLNNIGGNGISNKLEFQSEYKFSLAFENTEYLGYTTEKITNAMCAKSLPIYWGNSLVNKDFNTDSFINYHDFENENELIDYIIYLDNNKEEYLKKLKKPWIEGDKIKQEYSKENIKKFLIQILKNNANIQ